MALKTSLVISGDSASGKAALRDIEQGFDKAGTAATRSGAQIRSAANDVERAANRQAFAVRNAGQQVGDFGLQIADGTSISRAFSNQIGQLGFALSEMGGKAGKVGAALTGPVGIGFTIAAALAAPFVEELIRGGESADTLADRLDDATKAADSFGNAQSLVGQIIELTTGKLKTQNLVLIESIRLQATAGLRKAKQDEKNAAKEVAQIGRPSLTQRVGTAFGSLSSGGISSLLLGSPQQDALVRSTTGLRKIADEYRAGTINITQAREQVEQFAAANRKAKIDVIATVESFVKLGTARNEQKANQQALDAIDGKGIARELVPFKATGRPRAARKGPSAASLAASGLGISDQIADIEAQYTELPTAIKKANDQLRELEKIKAAIDRQPLLPGADALKGRIEALGVTIQNSINKPFDDYLEQQRQAAEIDKLLLQGRNDEAAALQVIIGLQQRLGPLSDDQLASVLATVRADRERSQVLRDQQALIRGNVEAVQSFRGALEQTVADALRGRFSLGSILTSIGNSAINLASQRIVEQLFGSTLRSLEDQARGSDKVDAAATTIAGALGKGSSAVEDFATTVRSISARIAGAPASAANDNGLAAATAAGGTPANDNASNGDIVVVARRASALAGQGVAEQLINIVDQTFAAIGVKFPPVVTGVLKDTLGKLEKSLPSLLKGAAIGATSSRIILGDRGTAGTIGSSIGGAIGGKVGEKFLSTGLSTIAKGLGGLASFAGPIGSIVGGLVGGLFGGLFKPAEKAKGGAITSTDGKISVSGNNADSKNDVSQASKSVQSGLQQIADTLGAEIGTFSVSISKYKTSFRVDPSGGGSDGGKYGNKNGVTKFDNNDAEGAIAFAIANAIADGAIAGVSKSVTQALQSSPDINKALKEAVKVSDLETALGGIGGQIAKEVKAFEKTAADRLRIAKAYGFDIVKVEELNAKQRLSLSEKLLKDQVGSLQDLIDEITSGSLFEGSAVDQRNILLDKVAAARADANAGVDGAGEKLAELLRQLDSVSRDAFGTTGGFAADRQLILDSARDTIARANQRVADAQKASDPALAETNAQLGESNDQLAKLVAYMRDSAGSLSTIAGFGSAGFTDQSQLRATAAY